MVSKPVFYLIPRNLNICDEVWTLFDIQQKTNVNPGGVPCFDTKNSKDENIFISLDQHDIIQISRYVGLKGP